MSDIDDGRHRLADRFTLLRADPYVLDACLWLTLSRLAWAVRDAYATRVAWEETVGSPSAAAAEETHRQAWRSMMEKLAAAAHTAAVHDAPQSATEGAAGTGVQADANRPSEQRRGSDGGGWWPAPTRYSTGDAQ